MLGLTKRPFGAAANGLVVVCFWFCFVPAKPQAAGVCGLYSLRFGLGVVEGAVSVTRFWP